MKSHRKLTRGPNKLTLLLLLGHDAIDFVRFRNVELGAVGDLLKVRAFIQSTAESGLPGGWLSLVPLLILAFKHSPGLEERGEKAFLSFFLNHKSSSPFVFKTHVRP